jgi:DNA-binding MarR family transcriptional regulator
MKDARSDKITPQQHAMLEYIFFNKSVTASQIADCLNISLPNASRELKKLSKLKIIDKKSHEKDRRKTTISLSDKGQNMMMQTFEKIQKNFWKLSGPLSEDEMKSILSSIKIIEEKILFS